MHKGPIHPIKGLLLIQRENSHRRVSISSIVYNIAEKSDVFSNESARNTARLIRMYNSMNDFKKATRDDVGCNLVVDV